MAVISLIEFPDYENDKGFVVNAQHICSITSISEKATMIRLLDGNYAKVNLPYNDVINKIRSLGYVDFISNKPTK